MRDRQFTERFYAHTKTADQSAWEALEVHLAAVSKYCQNFASKWGAAHLGDVAGRWHDLGKYSQAFQSYLKSQMNVDVHNSEVTGRVDHSTAGARFAIELTDTDLLVRQCLAYVIAGHHTGLGDAVAGRASLAHRLSEHYKIPEWKRQAPEEILHAGDLRLPEDFKRRLAAVFLGESGTPTLESRQHAGFCWAMFVRMLFSALVDADFLATEEFLSPDEAILRPKTLEDTQLLSDLLDKKVSRITQESSGSSSVNRCRCEILQACREAACQAPGFFSLSVPTGGGKTLAGLSFALRHILANRSKLVNRVVVAIPYTSIIEQTADVYRSIFAEIDPEIVLEHHCNLAPGKESDFSRLTSQNYDAPIIVTTNVQLFESLFANRSSRCRKLHNLSKSVIILDEMQMLPVSLLKPILLALKELVECYGCSIVFSTATQPAINKSPEFPIGIDKVREIIPAPDELYRTMRRVKVESLGTIELTDLSDRIKSYRQVLCVMNTRPNAMGLYKRLLESCGEDGLYHLSTWMCPAHRSRTITRIRSRLANGERCIVVSTQLIEAGVDVDFPVVFRALTGMDSIAQAAGRCNREGKQDRGTVFIFCLPDLPPPGALRDTAMVTQSLMRLHQHDLLDRNALRDYFRAYYWKNEKSWDSLGIMLQHLDVTKGEVNFSTIGREFRMIHEATIPIVVPYDEDAKRMLKRLRSSTPESQPLSRSERRLLDRFTVSLFLQHAQPGIGKDFQYLYGDQYLVLENRNLYDKEMGIDLSRLNIFDPGDLIA